MWYCLFLLLFCSALQQGQSLAFRSKCSDPVTSRVPKCRMSSHSCSLAEHWPPHYRSGLLPCCRSIALLCPGVRVCAWPEGKRSRSCAKSCVQQSPLWRGLPRKTSDAKNKCSAAIDVVRSLNTTNDHSLHDLFFFMRCSCSQVDVEANTLSVLAFRYTSITSVAMLDAFSIPGKKLALLCERAFRL